MKYDLLVYGALVFVMVAIVVSAWVIGRTPETTDSETRRVRVATVTLTGILVLFMFISVLYFSDPNGAGKEIFDKGFAAMLTLAGTISGYLFGAKGGDAGGAKPAAKKNTARSNARRTGQRQ